jgi:fibronectin type 3 domain-containing protein
MGFVTPVICKSTPLFHGSDAPNLRIGVTTSSGIAIQWDAVGGADAYVIYRITSGNIFEVIELTRVTTLSYFDRQVEDGGYYEYIVVPIVKFGSIEVEGLPSEKVASYAQPVVINPYEIYVVNTNSSLKVSWNAIPGVSGYEIQRSIGSDKNYGTPITLTSATYTHTGLGFYVTVYYRIRAFYMVDGVKIYTDYVYTSGTTRLATPTLTAKTVNPSSIALSWNAITGAASYAIYVRTPDSYVFKLLRTVTTTSYTHTGTFYDQYAYEYYVIAKTSTGSESSQSNRAEAYATLAAPASVKGTSTYDTVTLTYSAVAQAAGYEVMMLTVNDDSYTVRVVYEGSSLSTIVTDLHPNLEYYFVVTAYYYKNGYQYYGYTSDVFTIKTKMAIPQLSGTVLSQSSVSLKWTAVPEATSYNLYKKNLSTGLYEFVLETTDLSATVTGLSVGVPATFRVRANRQTELGQVISGYSVTTLTPALTAPSGLRWASIDYNTLTLAFTGNLDATGYEVYRATTATGTYTKIATVTTTEAVLSALTFNTTYYYKVRAYLSYEGGTTYSAYSSVISGKTALKAVSNPSAQSAGYASIQVNWSAVSGASGYEVWRSTGTSTTYALVKTQTTVGFLNTALVTNTTYNFKIRAYRLVGTTKVYGAYSSVVSTKPIPSVPTISVVSGGTNALKVSWPAVAGASGYEVSYAATEEGIYTLLPLQTALSATINGLTVDTPYYVKVRAYRLVGTLKVYSGYSAIVSAKPLPLTPTLTGTSGGFDRVNLSWSAIAGAAGYELYRLDGDTYTLISDQTGLTFTDLELITGTTRSYKVVAYAILSEVKIRSLDSTVLNVTPIPSLATNLKASFIDYNLLSFDWTDVSGATGYEISFASTATGAASVIADVSVSEFTRNGLTFNTTGYYRVRAYTTVSDIKVTGNWTSALAVKTALTAVTNPSAAYTAYNSIQINWSAVNGASGYEVWRSTGTSTTYALVKTQTTVGFLNTALVTNTRYNYKIRAYRLVGTTKVYGAYSGIVSSTPLPWAPNPTATSAAYNALKISWPAVAGANGYEVSYATSEAGPFTVLPTTTLTSATITNLLTNSTYTVRVRAYRTVNYKKVYGAYSSFITGTPIPSTPAPKVVSGGFDSLNLSWAAIAGATGYDVQWLNPATSTYETLIDTTALSTVHTGLVSGVAQSYRVYAYRLVGETKVYSNASTVITGTPLPSTVLGLKLSATNVSTLDFTWTSVLGASGYEVARSTTSTGVYTTLGSTETAAYQVTGLTFNTTSYLKVRAYTLVGDVKVYGAWTTAISAKTLPGTPTLTLSSPSYTSVQVDWAAVSGVTGYEVWRSTGTSTTYTLIKSQTTVGFQNTGLVFNTRYNYKVRAYRLVGTTKVYGSYSVITSQVTQVSAPSVLSESTFDSITLNWAAVSGANGYEVAIATSEGGPYTVSLQTTLTKTFSGLTTGSTYYVKVRSYRLISTTKVYGPYTSVIGVTPSLQVPTLQITGMTSTSITVSWASVPGATDYEVRIRQDVSEAEWVIEEVSELTVTFNDLDPSAFYAIQIRSLTKDTAVPVYSAYSEELIFSYSETS